MGLSIADITNSVLTDKNKVHSVSTLAQVGQPCPSGCRAKGVALTRGCLPQGWCGIGSEVFLSLPCSMGSNGSTRLAGVSLGPEEDAKLRESVSSLSSLMAQLRL